MFCGEIGNFNLPVAKNYISTQNFNRENKILAAKFNQLAFIMLRFIFFQYRVPLRFF